MASYDDYNNYILISKGGKVFTCFTDSYTDMLKKYIKNYVGYESANFAIDQSGWGAIADGDNKVIVNGVKTDYGNYAETNMFNSIVKRTKFRVSKAVYKHILVYSSVEALESAVAHEAAETRMAEALLTERGTDEAPVAAKTYSNCFLVSNTGKWFAYKNKTMKAALEQYMTDNKLAFEKEISADKALWDECNTLKIQNDLNALIKTFNALCKKANSRIIVAAVNYDSIVTIS